MNCFFTWWYMLQCIDRSWSELWTSPVKLDTRLLLDLVAWGLGRRAVRIMCMMMSIVSQLLLLLYYYCLLCWWYRFVCCCWYFHRFTLTAAQNRRRRTWRRRNRCAVKKHPPGGHHQTNNVYPSMMIIKMIYQDDIVNRYRSSQQGPPTSTLLRIVRKKKDKKSFWLFFCIESENTTIPRPAAEQTHSTSEAEFRQPLELSRDRRHPRVGRIDCSTRRHCVGWSFIQSSGAAQPAWLVDWGTHKIRHGRSFFF